MIMAVCHIFGKVFSMKILLKVLRISSCIVGLLFLIIRYVIRSEPGELSLVVDKAWLNSLLVIGTL